MSCNQIISFESLIPVPYGIEYIHPVNQNYFSIAVNTDDLVATAVPGKYSIGKLDILCPQKVSVEANLYEIRVSGYLTYSVSVQCLKSSDNFIPFSSGLGYISNSGVLTMSTVVPGSNKLPYLITGYTGIDPSAINISVSLISIDVENPPTIIDENTVIMVRGTFEIQTS